jgi:hypothetical protein
MLYVSNTDSNNIFPDNKVTDFVVDLKKDIFMNHDSTVELIEFRCRAIARQSKEVLYVMSDICERSIVHGKELPLLRFIPYSGIKSHFIEVYNPITLKTIPGCYNRFRIYIKDKNFTDVSVALAEAQITLRFKNVRY